MLLSTLLYRWKNRRSEKHGDISKGSRLINDRADIHLGLSDSLGCLAKEIPRKLPSQTKHSTKRLVLDFQ